MKNTPQWLNLLLQKKMLLILLLGFASGLPLGLSASTLQAWYAVDGVNMVTIGFLALVGQPYVYKFLWSPVLDKYRLPFLGLRRGWMLATQISIMVVLVLMSFMKPATTPYQLAFLALCLTILSATQDIAIDAYRTELLTLPERGMGTSMAVTGYRVAMLVSGGLTMIIAHYSSFSFTYLLMAALMGVGVFATLWGKEPQHYREKPVNFFIACLEPFKEFFSRKNAAALLAFIVLYKLGDAFAGSLTTAFLLKGVGFTLVEIGVINKTIGLASTLLGVFVGGVLMVKLGLFRSLLWFGILQAVTNLLFFGLAMVGQNVSLLVATVFLENFSGGLGTAAFMALVMSLCNARFTATQFALLSSFSAIGRVFVGPAAGFLVESVGWADFFLYTVLFAVPGLVVLWLIRDTIFNYEHQKLEDVVIDAVIEAKVNA